MSGVGEEWKRFGLVRGPGLPAPSGQYTVGCVDLMHQLEGDEQGGLLMRLFYPSSGSGAVSESRSESDSTTGPELQYAKWFPHKKYLEGTLAWSRSWFPWLMSSLMNLFYGIKAKYY